MELEWLELVLAERLMRVHRECELNWDFLGKFPSKRELCFNDFLAEISIVNVREIDNRQ